jgi:hypothetical protein
MGVKVWQPAASAHYAKRSERKLLQEAQTAWRRVLDPQAAASCAAHVQ